METGAEVRSSTLGWGTAEAPPGRRSLRSKCLQGLTQVRSTSSGASSETWSPRPKVAKDPSVELRFWRGIQAEATLAELEPTQTGVKTQGRR